jgi:hypothetical protein
VRYFHKLIEGVPVMPVMHALMRNPQIWTQDYSIVLRGENGNGTVVDRDLMRTLPPKVKAIAFDLMAILGGVALGSMIVTKLEPGKRVSGEPRGQHWYTPYYLMLASEPGSLMMCGDETVNMLTGEIWWCDPDAERVIVNNSKDDRVQMVIDIRIDP